MVRMGRYISRPTEDEIRQRKIDNLVMNALPKLEEEAKEHVFQNYATKSNVIRNIIIKNARDFGLTSEQITLLKENGDIIKVFGQRNAHLAPNGHGQILYNNQYWTLTMPQYGMLQMAISTSIPVKNIYMPSEKTKAFMRSTYGSFYNEFIPFSNMGSRELDVVLKQEEHLWEQYLIERVEEYINERRDKMIADIKKNVDDEMRIAKQGLTNLF